MAPRFLVLFAFVVTCVLGLDRTQPVASYIRTTFTVEDGLPSNVINAILQTRNGLMWIGTDAGLARFDGRHFTPVDFRGPRSTPQGVVRALAEGPDGDLWVATNSGVARIPSTAPDDFGTLPSTFYYPGSARNIAITSLKFSRGGVLWAGTSDGLYRFERGGFSAILPRFSILRIEEASNGNLLLITPGGVVEWDGSRAVQHPELAPRLGVKADEVFHVFEDSRGVSWYCTSKGVARQIGSSFEKIPPYGPNSDGAFRVYEDPQGTVWINKSNGLFRATAAGLEQLTLPNQNRYIYGDRDGDLWVGTNGDGLFRVKDRAVRMFTTADGLLSNVVMTVLESHEGRLWTGLNCGGLSWLDGERFRTYTEKDGLSNSCVWALAEDANNDLWVGTWGGGLFRFRDGRFTQYSIPQGLRSDVVRSIIIAHDGSLWLATADGLSVMRNGHFRNYTTADGLSTNSILAVYQDRRGVIWAGTSGGIDRLTGDRFMHIPSALEIFEPHYVSLSEGPLGGLYAFSAPKGISRIERNQLVPVSTDLDLMSATEFQRDLWFSGGNGIFRIAAADLSRSWQDRSAPLDYTSFGRADGLNSPQCSIGAPNMTITRDGKLWVATVQGLALLDLLRLPRTKRAPTIFVEEVTVGQEKQSIRHELVLPPGTHRLEVKFDSIEFTSPEKSRFQYRLDGVDGVWLDADTTRTAVYTSIPVGAHSFHIRACNRDGVWDRTGIVYNVTQLPFFYETNVFRLAVLAGVSLLLWGLYRVRLHRIAREFNMRLEERVDERTRIARELHDTLLQS
ncbi:MAG TPA: two-component regulator propeller domain-containing protein, partial [Bryobacteraceae bacterium]|nr:two-component regulator propeller domain-containing protein [Bryobacteraceae bacterium]